MAFFGKTAATAKAVRALVNVSYNYRARMATNAEEHRDPYRLLKAGSHHRAHLFAKRTGLRLFPPQIPCFRSSKHQRKSTAKPLRVKGWSDWHGSWAIVVTRASAIGQTLRRAATGGTPFYEIDRMIKRTTESLTRAR